VFYPSTPEANRATRVEVAAGQTVTGIDIRFVVRRLARISGRVLTAAGQPLLPRTTDDDGRMVRGRLFLNYLPRPGVVRLPERFVEPDANGGFQFDEIEPGEYVLYAISESPRRVSVPESAVSAVREFVGRTILVSGRDIEPLELRLVPTGTITGRVVIEGPARPPAAAPAPHLTALQRGVAEWPQLRPRLSTMVDPVLFEDGTFDLAGVIGSALIELPNLPRGWYVKSISSTRPYGMHEAIPADSGETFTIVLADEAAPVLGRVLDAPSRKQGDLVVYLFSTDERRWFQNTPFMHFYRPVDDYFIDNVPPGDYYLVALTRETDQALARRGETSTGTPDAIVADRMKTMSAIARRVTVTPRRPLEVDLPVARLPVP
jgi:hypothetical protein